MHKLSTNLQSIISLIRRKFLGFDKNKIHELERRVIGLEILVNRYDQNNQVFWLYQNKFERMDATDEIFDKDRREFHLARYKFACDYVKDLKIADIACGTGYGTELLKNKGKANFVLGIDISEQAIAYAQEKHHPEGTEFKVASADNTGLTAESFDVIISFETIEHVPDDKTLLTEFHRLLKPGGLLICSTPNQWPITQYHLRTYNRQSFERVLNINFRIDKLYNQNSGTNSPYNHKQPSGIVKSTDNIQDLAECFIILCYKENK